MCGICGIIRKDNASPNRDLIEKMCNAMIHRGPDDSGIHVDGMSGLGMRRLQIIDLHTGHQPVFNEDKTIWIVFNGEIYNYQELRQLLLNKKHVFSTQTDTEVILHLYEEYGENCVDYLNGMFCFAIWNKNKNELFIARDRLGIKQLYYYEDSSVFIFGSEIKVVLAALNKACTINYQAISDYLSLLYIPAPLTVYQEINKLPPAHSVSLSNGKTVIKKYWKISYCEIETNEQSLINNLSEQIRKAVSLQMISDVPLGAFLSGGVDSSLLVANMARLSSKPVETFSVLWGEDGAEFDERIFSRMVSKQYKTSHHEFLVEPNIEEIVDGLIGAFDEPFADESAIPNFYLCRETRKHVTVALSGLGGDEIAGGYERYLGMKFMNYYNFLPNFIKKNIVNSLVKRLPDSKTGNHFVNRLKRFAAFSDLSYTKGYYSFVSEFSDADKYNVWGNKIIDNLSKTYSTYSYFEQYAMQSNGPNDLNKLLCIDQNTYLVDDLLVLSDRMSMQHSLEMRVPFLDHTLVEAFAKIPQRYKIHGNEKKYILKKIAETMLPRELIYRRKKGFSVPLVLWFRGKLKPYVEKILNEDSVNKTGLLNSNTVKLLLNEHFAGKENHDEKIWSMICLMLWYDKYIDTLY